MIAGGLEFKVTPLFQTSKYIVKSAYSEEADFQVYMIVDKIKNIPLGYSFPNLHCATQMAILLTKTKKNADN